MQPNGCIPDREKEKNQMKKISEIFSGASAPLMGTTEDRQSAMDEHCRSLRQVTDLNSLRANVTQDTPFKALFSGFQDELKPPTKFSPDRNGGFVWSDQKPGNPVILGGKDGVPQEDRLSYTFMLDGYKVDFHQPDHYRSRAVRYSLVLGSTPRNECLALQGNWQATIGGEWRSWWAYTAILLPTISAEDWFDRFVMLDYNVNSYEEYAEEVTKARDEREAAFELRQKKGAHAGANLAANI